MIDLEYFVRNRPKNDKSRVMFITGDNLGNLPSGYFQVNVRLPPYGSHHTKMSLLKTKSGHLIGNESKKMILVSLEPEISDGNVILGGEILPTLAKI